MSKNRKVLRGIATGILYICTVYLLFSIISTPFGKQNIILALAVTAGFIYLGSSKKDKDK